MAATCRHYGISRPCYYTWLRRYEAEGLDGLKDRSSAPHHTPHATHHILDASPSSDVASLWCTDLQPVRGRTRSGQAHAELPTSERICGGPSSFWVFIVPPDATTTLPITVP
ncbi:helix-turn-helix domain-containing protein [Streptomyces sp. NPDC057684]|uniref:helix-turn-helix domain-containing protein n=1 Tax=unclassified Streptomyces TaxID=2593676 RepID=UPI0036B3515A